MAAPSVDDLYLLGRARLLLERPDLAAQPGDVTDVQLMAAAAMADRVVGWGAQRFRATFIDGATGADLTELADDHRKVQRQGAVHAVGQLTFTRATTGNGTIPAGTRVATEPDADGAFEVFTTDVALVFGGADASLSVAATAATPGRAGNIDTSATLRVLDQLFDTFTVSAPSRFVGGAPEESDEDLRERFRRPDERGTLAALVRGAKEVPLVAVATPVEDPDTGQVTLFVADADGHSNATMVAAVETEIENWRAAGALVQVVGGALAEQSIAVTLTVRTGVGVAALVDRVRAAIVGAVNRLRIGETLYLSLIQSAARAVDQDAIVDVAVTTPAANLAPASNEVIRTRLDLVTAT